MNTTPRNALRMAALLAAFFCAVGCHSNQGQNATNSNPPTQDQAQDPAAANLAPASYDTSVAPAQTDASAGSQSYSSTPDSSDYSEPATETAAEAPPPLPDYQQPPDPGDGYLWTPGYWNYASNGYYWVPGAWVEPPYQGALWTPGYWASSVGRYAFHPGHWGTHIGFYGGVNYGFGYVGLGYEGGYWNNGHFNYNREYNNVDTRVVHNVYSYHVQNRVTEVSHTSFNGGTGGIQVRPRPQEVTARQEPYAPRMTTQVQHAESFKSDRNQFASVNHGQPGHVAVSNPIQADRNVRPMPPQAHPQPVLHGGPARQAGQPNKGRQPEDRQR